MASCFKIMACGNNDSVDRDDLQAPESKDSSDRRKWSFRKRSARHRVLSNSAASETPSGNKDSPDDAIVSFQMQASSTTVPEKTSGVPWMEDKTQLPTPISSKLCEAVTSTEDDIIADITLDESVVTTIQAAIRGFLARRVLLKHKNIVKLQAAIRGHIVRQHAVGSLRCVQAIVKMQVLVRERRARLLLQGSRPDGKLDDSNEKDNCGSTSLGKENSGKPNITHTSVEKLLGNRFARQLLESKPRTKTINIKCDPSKSDSAWEWLERWMSVSSMENEQSLRSESVIEPQDKKRVEKSDYQLENANLPEDSCQSKEIKSGTEVSAVPSEVDENVITYAVDSFDSHAVALSSVSDSIGNPCSQNTGEVNSSDSTLDSLPNQACGADLVSKTEHDSFQDESKMKHEQHIDSVKRPRPEEFETNGKKHHSEEPEINGKKHHSEEPETNGKKFMSGSRKASNPAFIAAQSKFEELSTVANSARSVISSNQDASLDSSLEAVSPVTNFRTTEIVPDESSFMQTSGVEVGGSECGTELSITSTLDSPDRPEVGVANIEKGTEHFEDGTGHLKSKLNSGISAEVDSPTLERDLSCCNSVEEEKDYIVTSVNYEHDGSPKAVDSLQEDEKPHIIETGAKVQLESEISHQVSKSSPEASPRSHMTVPDSQETHSSRVSAKQKKSGTAKSGSNHKRKSESSGKGKPSDSNHDSGTRNSLEELPKDQKSGKRRNSFGSARTDHSDHEPRDSSSSNPLPSYMQATESAKAKALNSSPRSSPDMQDKDFYVKKRQSLPSSNTRQGSPRVQRSMSQAHQGVKGNGVHSPQERKWRR